MNTSSIKKSEITREWFIVDAQGSTLGRLSSKIAHILRGKNKVNFTPHMDMSDFIIVINAEKVQVTGNKDKNKQYWKHSGFPGSGKFTSFSKLKDSNPESIMVSAILIQRASKKKSPKNIKTTDLFIIFSQFSG